MSIFVDKKLIEISIRYVMDGDKLKVLDEKEKEENAVATTFMFRKPNWGDMRRILGTSSSVDESGATSLNIYKLMDSTIKSLLEDWTLKDEKGKKIEITDETIDDLPFEMISALFSAVSNKVPMPGK